MNDVDLKYILNQYFRNYEVLQIPGGATAACLYKIITKDKGSYILKMQPAHSATFSLHSEKQNYEWLLNKVPVPAVGFFHTTGSEELLCVSELSGKTLEAYIGEVNAEELVTRYAHTLQLLHSLPINSSAQVQSLEIKIRKAKFNVENNLVDMEDLQPENRGATVSKLFDRLLQLKPSDHELVFTHGDYSLDNIVFHEDRLSGFIDIGGGGVADKYQDITIAVRNIQDHFDNDLVYLFCREYGIPRLDEGKIKFYMLLDEFY
ncbi:MAG: aminoglycoside 3'-phosphotransferase [Chitinophagaceae bacterium]|nr:MAG: aminoglycoside 3'-phosphotransferase [Chitinophagaceae bacterium]